MSEKSKEWDEHKAAVRAGRQLSRDVPVIGVAHTFGSRQHACKHTWKHHKASGRCRPGCECTAGAVKAGRKERAR